MRLHTLLIALLCVCVVQVAHAQDDPPVVAVVGDVPALAQIVPSDQLRPIDPAAGDRADWSGVEVLVLPDLYAAAYPALITAAEQAQIPIFQTTTIARLDAWRDQVIRLGQATGYPARADRLIRRLDRRLAFVRAAIRDRAPVRVLVLTPEAYTFGQDALITELIETAGGINVAAEAGFDDYRQIGEDTIQALAPNVILFSPTWDQDAARAFAKSFHTRGYRLSFSPTQPADPGMAAVLLALTFHPAAMLFRN